MLGLEFLALQLGLQIMLPPLSIGLGDGRGFSCSSIVGIAGDRDLLLLAFEILAKLHFLRLRKKSEFKKQHTRA